ncbi:MAG: MobQ family relaxase [Candidatus Sedimenticola sp. (ex Thyasira tokunagai)]
MAIYHNSFQIITRSKGQSSVAAAAYRSGARLKDNRTGITHDFTSRKGVETHGIIAPKNAPSWVLERSSLWNKVESMERRNDAQLCREINIALPKELTLSQNVQLVKSYVSTDFVRLGMIADICFHDMESNNPHVHVMLTMRELSGNSFGNKNRDWNNKENIMEWRRRWAERVNTELKNSGIDQQIDHRSLENQGVVRKPTRHKGYYLCMLEKLLARITSSLTQSNKCDLSKVISQEKSLAKRSTSNLSTH